jgi:hypothetical protein
MRAKSWGQHPTTGPGHVQPRPMIDRLAERIAQAAPPERQATDEGTAKGRRWFEHPVGRQG